MARLNKAAAATCVFDEDANISNSAACAESEKGERAAVILGVDDENGAEAIKSSRRRRLEAYFASHGIGIGDVPKAIFIHEFVGLGLLASIWLLCYAAQPSSKILPPLRVALQSRGLWKRTTPLNTSTSNAPLGDFAKALARAEKRLASSSALKSPYFPQALRRNPRRLAVSLAESVVLRNAARPATIPLKLWIAWKIVVWSNAEE